MEAKDKAHNISASIIDSQTGAWGLGIAYYGHLVADKKFQTRTCFMWPQPCLLSVTCLLWVLLFTSRTIQGLGPEPFANFFNLNAGIFINLPIGLSIGAVLDNLIKPKGREKNLGFALAAAFDLGAPLRLLPLALSIDWLMDDVKNTQDLHHVIMAGGQYTIAEMVPVRLGYHFSDLSSRQN